jgi:hypothetical protein
MRRRGRLEEAAAEQQRVLRAHVGLEGPDEREAALHLLGGHRLARLVGRVDGQQELRHRITPQVLRQSG